MAFNPNVAPAWPDDSPYKNDPSFDPLGGIPRSGGVPMPFDGAPANPIFTPPDPGPIMLGGPTPPPTFGGPMSGPITLGGPPQTPTFGPGGIGFDGSSPYAYTMTDPYRSGPSLDLHAAPASLTGGRVTPEAQAAYAKPRTGITVDPSRGSEQVPGGRGSGSSIEDVTRAYRDLLGREPDAEGLRTWVGNPDFMQGILGSDEYKARQGGGSGGNFSEGGFWSQWDSLIGNYPPTPEGLRRLKADHPELSFNIVGGSGGDIELPNGQVYDVMIAAGAGGGKGWQRSQGSGGGGGIHGDDFDTLLKKWGEQFHYDPFKGIKGDEVFNDPGYVFRRDQGLEAMQNSAAAKGLLRSGGTFKDLALYNQQLASQEYGNAYDRALQDYKTNRSDAWDEYLQRFFEFRDQRDSTYDKLSRQAGMGLGAA